MSSEASRQRHNGIGWGDIMNDVADSRTGSPSIATQD